MHGGSQTVKLLVVVVVAVVAVIKDADELKPFGLNSSSGWRVHLCGSYLLIRYYTHLLLVTVAPIVVVVAVFRLAPYNNMTVSV